MASKKDKIGFLIKHTDFLYKLRKIYVNKPFHLKLNKFNQ